MIKYIFYAQGHPNVTSKHRSTLEVTLDPEIGIQADCIIGVKSDKNMLDFPGELKKAISREGAQVRLLLSTTRHHEEIIGKGHPDLSLDHPTDMVCRKSDYICSRTLMIKADKAACDLNQDLIEDLKKSETLKVEIIVE
ncbi:MAG: DUF371 domain-containing protein [Euryarchaeota archaeon]|nr:DUF371 domain-containing protein [Euryarchaeota archaeon]MBU4607798.1 DUF371 domain-containing protein [Euryarchaeota archaeon]MBV1755165.1 DUF371 domain-containing protein [Methanobacterium sp.]